MSNRARKYRDALSSYDATKMHTLEEAIGTLRAFPKRSFDESVELTFYLNIDGRQAGQALRGTVLLPHGTGRDIRVLVITQGDLAKEAEDAGADDVGGPEVVERIQKGWLEFDLVIASPDMMGQVGQLGRILGPRGLMPNPKTGTVTREIGQAVKEAKAGRVEYRADAKSGNNAQAAIGKLSFEDAALVDNARTFSDVIFRAKPAVTKGDYVRKLVLSTTMGPAIRIDPAALAA